MAAEPVLCLSTSPCGAFTCYREVDAYELPKHHSFTDPDDVEHCWDDSGKSWAFEPSKQGPQREDFPDGYYCDYASEGGAE